MRMAWTNLIFMVDLQGSLAQCRMSWQLAWKVTSSLHRTNLQLRQAEMLMMALTLAGVHRQMHVRPWTFQPQHQDQQWSQMKMRSRLL